MNQYVCTVAKAFQYHAFFIDLIKVTKKETISNYRRVCLQFPSAALVIEIIVTLSVQQQNSLTNLYLALSNIFVQKKMTMYLLACFCLFLFSIAYLSQNNNNEKNKSQVLSAIQPVHTSITKYALTK